MKTIKLLLLLGIGPGFFFTGCAKKGCTDSLSYTYDSDAKEDDGSCKYYYGGKNYGQLDVGSEKDMDNEYDIYFNGTHIGRSLYYFPNGLGCGNPQAVGKILPSGPHTVRAVGNGGTEIREGIIDLQAQVCKVVLIENLKLVNSGNGGGNGGGGGGGGGGSTGTITFWLNQDLGCGDISVTINSYGTSIIDSYYTSGNPGCFAAGCANFSGLSYGAYSYNASSDMGCSWSGNIDLSSSCSTIQLTL